jgi:hypothetical protein
MAKRFDRKWLFGGGMGSGYGRLRTDPTLWQSPFMSAWLSMTGLIQGDLHRVYNRCSSRNHVLDRCIEVDVGLLSFD